MRQAPKCTFCGMSNREALPIGFDTVGGIVYACKKHAGIEKEYQRWSGSLSQKAKRRKMASGLRGAWPKEEL